MSTLSQNTGAARVPWWQAVAHFPLGRVAVSVALGVLGGIWILARDTVPAVAMLILVLGGSFLLLVFTRPLTWIYVWIGFALLLPPFPFEVGSVEVRLHLAVAIFVIAVVVGCLRVREWHVDDSGLAASCVAFLGVLLVSIPLVFLYSGSSIGFQSLLRWMLLCQGFVLMAWLAWGPLPRQWDPGKLLGWILLASLLSAAFAVVDFEQQWTPPVPFAPQYIYLPWGAFRRAQGVFYESSSLGNLSAMMLLLILALGPGVRQQLKLRNVVIWSAIPLLGAALLLSFSRASLVALVVGILVLTSLRRGWRFKTSTAVWSLAIPSCALALVMYLVPDIGSHYLDRMVSTVQDIFGDPTVTLSGRTEMWRILANFLWDNPQHLLLGIGYKSFPDTNYLGQRITVDNMYLSMLVEAGLPGLLGLFLLCAAFLKRSYRLSKAKHMVVAALGRFLFAFWCSEMVQLLSGDTLTYWRVTPVYLAILGFTLRWSRNIELEARIKNGLDHAKSRVGLIGARTAVVS